MIFFVWRVASLLFFFTQSWFSEKNGRNWKVATIADTPIFYWTIMGGTAPTTYKWLRRKLWYNPDVPTDRLWWVGFSSVLLYCWWRKIRQSRWKVCKLPKIAPENRPSQKRKLVFQFQPSIFRCKLAVSFREGMCFFSPLFAVCFFLLYIPPYLSTLVVLNGWATYDIPVSWASHGSQKPNLKGTVWISHRPPIFWGEHINKNMPKPPIYIYLYTCIVCVCVCVRLCFFGAIQIKEESCLSSIRTCIAMRSKICTITISLFRSSMIPCPSSFCFRVFVCETGASFCASCLRNCACCFRKCESSQAFSNGKILPLSPGDSCNDSTCLLFWRWVFWIRFSFSGILSWKQRFYPDDLFSSKWLWLWSGWKVRYKNSLEAEYSNLNTVFEYLIH